MPVTPEAIERALANLGVRPSRARGQSFLTDPFVADALAALAVDGSDRPVVEVGGGLGVVTAALLRRGVTSLTVVEHDPRLAAHLDGVFAPAVRVVVGDALEFDFAKEAVVTGSLPYSVATPLLLRLIRQRQPKIAVLVQKEVADRFGAAPGSKAYGRPTILAAALGEVELFREVPATAFYPRPEVAGRLLTHRTSTGAPPVGSVDRLERLVRVLFSSRRKQLGNLFPRLGLAPGRSEAVVAAAGWPSAWQRMRPEELPPEAYFALERAIGAAGD